jgi:transcriptional regulator with XRE-family HTH domain
VDLGEYMDARRKDLGLRWEEVAAQAQITSSYLRAVRAGRRRPSEIIASKLERALGWTPGSIEVALAGGEPAPTPDRTGPMDWTTIELPEEDIAIVAGHWDELSEFARRWIARSMREAVEELDGKGREGDNPQSQEPNP